MTSAPARAVRVAWCWCLAYTVLVPREQRARRRDEIRNHLWESRSAGTAAWATVRATAAGMGDDLSWAITALAARLGRAFLTPTPYLVLAAFFPVQAAFVFRLWPVPENTVQGVSTIAAIAMLLAAGGLALAGRHRRR
jgi:hypothetical protein